LATINAILDFSLIEQNDKSETYSMHALVHDWIRASIKDKEDEGLLQIEITTLGLAVPEANTRDYWITERRLLPHIIHCSQYFNQVSEIQKHFDEETYLSSLHNLGNLYRDQGRLTEAEAMYKETLVGCEKAFGVEHQATLATVNYLGILYWRQSRHTEAETMYKRALAGYEKALGVEHVSTLDAINNLGILYDQQGRLAEAEVMYKKAVSGKEKALGVAHPSTLGTVKNLLILYQQQGRLAEAETVNQKLEITNNC
jgi:tetratricopeptide (TPR) repeat protein